jgi:hypothetical protein
VNEDSIQGFDGPRGQVQKSRSHKCRGPEEQKKGRGREKDDYKLLINSSTLILACLKMQKV